MTVDAKICGLSDPAAVQAAAEGGARFMGLVFYPPSPRCVTPEQAGELVRRAPDDIAKVGVFVDPSDADIARVLAQAPLDFLQLHGAETPERVAGIRAFAGCGVIKAVRVARAADIADAAGYGAVADWLLFDAKAPASDQGALPGGNARRFDWRLLSGRAAAAGHGCPWILSGGLDAANVAEAVKISGARAVDVSSGVEAEPGRKDPARIRAFLKVVSRL